MPAPTPMQIALMHQNELRGIAEQHAIVRSLVIRLMVGRYVRVIRSNRCYRVTEIEIAAGGGILLKGTPPRGRLAVAIGTLQSIECITEAEAKRIRRRSDSEATKWVA